MISNDLPITSVVNDKLNRSTYAKRLAEAIMGYFNSESFTIGIYGKWGSGKTSVINMIEEQLQENSLDLEEDKPIIMRFNPWIFAEQQQLVDQFFKQLADLLKKDLHHKSLKKAGEVLESYSDALGLLNLIPGVGLLGTILSILSKGIGQSISNNSTRNIQSIKNEVVEILKQEKTQIVIIIDDIDRLSNEQIRAVFQLVKSLADFPNTVYILAFDRDVVIKALAEIQKGDGEEYLQKIIQVPFELPESKTSNIHQIFFDKLEDIYEGLPADWNVYYFSEIFQTGIRPYLTSIRSVVRYTNSYSLRYIMLKGEVNTLDLLAITVLQVFEPDVYARIGKHKDELCGGFSGISDYEKTLQDKTKKAVESILKMCSEKNADSVKNLLCLLFPKINTFYHNTYGFYNHYESLKGNLICNSRNFSTYFALSVSDRIPPSFIHHLILDADESELKDSIIAFSNNGQINEFFDHVNSMFYKTETTNIVERAYLVLCTIFSVWHKLKDDTENSIFKTAFEWNSAKPYLTICNSLNEECKFEFTLNIFNCCDSDLIPLITVYDWLKKDKEKSDSKERLSENAILFTNDQLEQLKNTLYAKIVLERETLLDREDFYIVFEFIENENSDYAKLLLETEDKPIEKIIQIVTAFVLIGFGENRFVHKLWQPQIEWLNRYIDIDDVYRKIIQYCYTSSFDCLEPERKEKLVAFILAYKSDENGILGGSIRKEQIDKKIDEFKTCLVN